MLSGVLSASALRRKRHLGESPASAGAGDVARARTTEAASVVPHLLSVRSVGVSFSIPQDAAAALSSPQSPRGAVGVCGVITWWRSDRAGPGPAHCSSGSWAVQRLLG